MSHDSPCAPRDSLQAFQVDENSPEYLALHGGNQQERLSVREQQQRDRALLEEHFEAVEDEEEDEGEGDEEGEGDGDSDGGEEEDAEEEQSGAMKKGVRCVKL